MKAILFRKHGGPEVLEYADTPTPTPGPGEALVKLRVASLNRMDIFVRDGWRGLQLPLPHISGADGAGEIAAITPSGHKDEAQILEIGDRVVINPNLGCGKCQACLSGWDNRCANWHLLGETVPGTYAEFVSLPLRQLYKLHATFNYHIAAGAALVYQTAWHSLVTRGNLQAGETILIVGAGGGVNTACIDIARYLGAKVLVVGSSDWKLEKAAELGASILINRSKQEDWARAVFQATNKRGVDVVVDNVGVTFMSSLRTLKKGGRLLTVGNSAAPKFEIDNRYIFARHLTIIGSTMSTLADFSAVMDLIVAGKLTPALDKVFPLKEAALAQQCLMAGENFGKITLDIG